MSNNKKLRGRFCVGNILSIILMVVFSILIFVAMAFFSEVSTDVFFANCLEYPLVIVANLAPIVLVMFFLYGATAHSPFSIFFTGALFLVGAEVNNYKIILRSDPFMVSDLSLIRELAGILRGFDAQLMILSIFLIVLIVVVIVVLLFFFRSAAIRWWKRIVICLCCIVFSVALYFTLYSNSELYSGLEVEGNRYCKYDVYSSTGWAYSFIYEADKFIIKAPEGYDKDEYQEKSGGGTDPKETSGDVKPHVIMIMSEAFTDLSENPNLDFSNYRDPLENYKSIVSESVVSGHVAVDVFAGGTATTEFEVLSGIDVEVINSSSSPYNLIRKDFYALPGIMKDLGYDATALHPGDSWFYNRDNVYRYMGFDDFICLENGIDENAEIKGGCVSENATYEYLMDIFNTHTAQSDDPLLEFCVTIQNHGGYALKYGYLNPNFSTNLNLEDSYLNQLTNYFEGVIDADMELGEFIEELRYNEEPVVVVYWGDHYPSLPGVYDELGYGYMQNGTDYTDLDMYYTPFFIWQNDAAAAITPIAENAAAEDLGDDEIFNAAFLGTTLLQLLGYDDVSPFMSYANEVRETLPVHVPTGYMDARGIEYRELSGDLADVNTEYKNWSYYMFFDQ